MVFTYWNGEPSGVEPFQRAWESVDTYVSVYDDLHVLGILSQINPDYIPLYSRIRIAACKSDIARLVLLYGHGGFYIDAHGAPKDLDAWNRLLDEARQWEVVLYDEPNNHVGDGDVHILTGALAGWRGSPILKALIGIVFQNLQRHAALEVTAPARPSYNIFVLTGPWAVRAALLTLTKPFVVRPEFAQRVLVHTLSGNLQKRGFLWYINYGYRRPGQHWSERQETEPLFEAA